MKTRTALILTSLLWIFPYLLLGGAGILWLAERGWSFYWLILAAVSKPLTTGSSARRMAASPGC